MIYELYKKKKVQDLRLYKSMISYFYKKRQSIFRKISGGLRMKKILFSPIGGTDPISNDHDGALLHICRVYQPDILYLYLSKEILKHHEEDNRYHYCLRKLEEKIGHIFEIHWIIRKDLEDVHLFDTFIDEYQRILHKIQKEYKDSILYLNVSSGTPGMKSALQILALTLIGDVVPIQVSTPEKRMNPHQEDPDDYDPEYYWELNEDNEDHFLNRCRESKYQYLLDEFKKQNIIKFVRIYNYGAAIQEAETLENPLSSEIMSYLKAAYHRTQLNQYGITHELRNKKSKIMPIRNEKYCNIFEYLLTLQIKVRREEYVDFIRGVTPVILDLFLIALKEYCEIDYKKYVKKSGGIERWDPIALDADPRMKKVSDRMYGNRGRPQPMYSSNVLPYIEAYSRHPQITDLSRQLRKIDENRNIPAHEIVSITKDWITKHTGYSPEEIFDMLKTYAMMLPMGIKKDFWDSYDNMNQRIIDFIERG